jgi:hypothetical protein
MPIAIDRGKVLGDVAYEIARLKHLLADLERIASGLMPTAGDLASSPLLDDYEASVRPMICLTGRCVDHPHLRGPMVTTTDVWVMAPDLGWCRTLGRFYRLGRHRGEAYSS